MMSVIDCDIKVMRDERSGNAKAGVAVASLGAEDGDEITFIVNGNNEEKWAQFAVNTCEKLGVCDSMQKCDVEYMDEEGDNLVFIDQESYESISVNLKEVHYRPESVFEFSKYTLYFSEGTVRYIFDKE